MTNLQIVEQVVTHALKNYEVDGWDFIVECYTRDEIAQTLHAKGITELNAAIAYFHNIGKLLDERRREVQAEIF